MQNAIRLFATLIFLVGVSSIRAQQLYEVCANEEIYFALPQGYWGVPFVQYSEDGETWNDISGLDGTPIPATPEISGYYRFGLYDEECDSSYFSFVFEIMVIDCSVNGPCGEGNSVFWGDYEYPIVEIGDQCWFAENLRYSGNIPEISDPDAWAAVWNNGNSTEQPAWCFYENDLLNGETFGKLYNWYAVSSGSLCPEGWHIPSYDEWLVLIDHLGGTQVAGGKMKAEEGWLEPNAGATNESGFSGLPGLYRDGIAGSFDVITGSSGYWWSSSEHPFSPLFQAFDINLVYDSDNAQEGASAKNDGFSCRCIKD